MQTLARRIRTLAFAAAAAGLAVASSPAAELAKVTLASTTTMTDLPFFIARARGYFREEGVDVETLEFDSGARMMPALASGEIDVATGGTSASLYNAIARGIPIRIVSDKSRTSPGRHSQTLVARKALIDSGRVKTIADLKGLSVASSATGSSAMATLNRLCKLAGLQQTDIERVYLGVPQQIAAMANGALDIAMPTEPVGTEIVRRGLAAKLMTDDEIYPDHQVAVMFYSGHFRQERPDAARAFMRGYLRGVRAMNAAIVGGKLAGADGREFAGLIAANTAIKDVDELLGVTMSANNDDGIPNVDSLREDFEVYRDGGLLEPNAKFDEAIDLSFVRAADAELAARKAN